MLSLQDCVDFSGLTDDEVRIIADHERLPLIVATELGSELLKTPKGIFRIKTMMLEELERAKLTGHHSRARAIDGTYLHFNARYPTARVL